MKIVAWMSSDGRLIAANKRDNTASASVANRYNRPLCELNDARAAVAELIEAADALWAASRPAWPGLDGTKYSAAEIRLRAARERIGGAK